MLIVLILADQAAVSLLSVNFCIQDVFFPLYLRRNIVLASVSAVAP